jgi:hypothetical protein
VTRYVLQSSNVTRQGFSFPNERGTASVSPFLVSTASYHRLVGATLPDFDRAAYVRGFVGSRPSPSTALAVSIPCDDEGLIDHKLALKWAVNQRITTGFSSTLCAFIACTWLEHMRFLQMRHLLYGSRCSGGRFPRGKSTSSLLRCRDV